MSITSFFEGFKSILKYLNVFVYIYKGLIIAEASLTSAIEELKTQFPDFKYTADVEEVLKYLIIIRETLGKLMSVFGTDTEAVKAEALAIANARVKTLSDTGVSPLSVVGDKIKEFDELV